MWQITEKTVVNNLKSNYEKLTEILLRLISNKQNSSELIKLTVKVFNSVVFKYL